MGRRDRSTTSSASTFETGADENANFEKVVSNTGGTDRLASFSTPTAFGLCDRSLKMLVDFYVPHLRPSLEKIETQRLDYELALLPFSGLLEGKKVGEGDFRKAGHRQSSLKAECTSTSSR